MSGFMTASERSASMDKPPYFTDAEWAVQREAWARSAREWREGGGDKPQTKRDNGAATRPTIRLVAGEMESIADEVEIALIKAGGRLYQRDGKIVFVSYTPAKTGKGEDTVTIQILERGDTALTVDMAASAHFERRNKKSKVWGPADPPLALAKALKELALGKLRFPILHGVITAPTLRADGSVLSEPGYDAATGLLFDPRGVAFPAIPEQPTRASAEAAYESLCKLIKDFPFKQDHDRQVALSAILTACVRRSLPTAPLHAFTAPTAGSGKGKLVDIACVIATGYRASALGSGGREEELEKRLAAKLMAGEPFIALDNCTQPLGGELICSMLTQERMSLRILGLSQAPSISTGAFVTASGNNLVIKGDLIRRTMLCRIDARVEQPETRVFDNDPVTLALDWRADLVTDALTILRAYHVAGRPGKTEAAGLVRGLVGPCPRRSSLAWRRRPGRVHESTAKIGPRPCDDARGHGAVDLGHRQRRRHFGRGHQEGDRQASRDRRTRGIH
jgi:putative DNA primase/helicase